MSSIESQDFGPNQGFIEELYASYLKDPSSVGAQWQGMFGQWKAAGRAAQAQPAAPAPAAPSTPAAPAPAASAPEAPAASAPAAPVTSLKAGDALPAMPGATAVKRENPYIVNHDSRPAPADDEREDEFITMKGMDRGLAKNMDASLTIPTATTVRSLPARMLFDNRTLINNHLKTVGGGKVSFTHLIAYAMAEALAEMPEMNYSYKEDEKGRPTVVKPAHVGLGLAIDVTKPDGSRSLVVPSIKKAETLTFPEFLDAYEDLVARGRDNKLGMEDYAGTTVSLTNPGGFGTTHSVPRLMNGQGLIMGVGSMTYPPAYQGASEEEISRAGVSKVMHVTATYDHRVIQGGISGRFLRLMEQKLLGLDGFYNRIFASLRIPFKPFAWAQDQRPAGDDQSKETRVAALIEAYRTRGHLLASTDPLAFRPTTHPDLELATYGLSIWDLDRSFPTGGFGGTSRATLRQILDKLRTTYSGTTGIEYMHIDEPEERKWFQEKLEGKQAKVSEDEQLRIFRKLTQAEVFEEFLATKYVGQKRFGLEGGEAMIPGLAAVLAKAADEGTTSAVIGMAHRGRLSTLVNIAGKPFQSIVAEFDGMYDPDAQIGSGDVKYHLGLDGEFTTADGKTIPVSVVNNPSHLEAADGTLVGIVRGRIDRLALEAKTAGKELEDPYSVLPIMIHGDAAFAGQGVVAEIINMSTVPGYKVGGTFHIVVNNQIGFTTLPDAGRSSTYTTDHAKGLGIPVFHVNGDDPEAVVRASKLAYEYRQAFHKDVILDLICYRLRGHNEGDDPTMTQPTMYETITTKKTTRDLYADKLVKLGELTQEQVDGIEEEFKSNFNDAFNEVREVEELVKKGEKKITDVPGAPKVLEETEHEVAWTSGISREMIERIGDVHVNMPEGFTIHKKIGQLFQKRAKMAREGGIDWGFGELLAFGSLLMEGVPIRLTGEEARRATFAHRQAVAHDIVNGQEWTPIAGLVENEAPFDLYDSVLSEYAVMAFEYGYSVERPDVLTFWEGQFGDFANGAQTTIDEMITSGEQKWNQRSNLVLLLPHGFEGQGPDHSSSRVERYLQMCAQDNMVVAQASTPANWFHLLRRQAYARPRKPLIALTPKQLLRRKGVTSSVEEFTSGEFKPVIGEVNSNVHDVNRVILCTGRVYYDLAEKRDADGDMQTAIIRLEQLYPNPVDELAAELAKYPGAEILWVQDEPGNYGAWSHLAVEMFPTMGISVRRVSRPNAASPSTGLATMHKAEQAKLLEEAFRR